VCVCVLTPVLFTLSYIAGYCGFCGIFMLLNPIIM